MAGIDENVLHAPPFVDDCGGRMKAIGLPIELATALEQTALPAPLSRLPVGRIHAPEPKLHAVTFTANNFEASRDRIQRKIHGVDVARILEIGVDDLRRCARRPGHLPVRPHLRLVPGDEEERAVVNQCGRFVLRQGGRIFFDLPGGTAVRRAKNDQLVAELMVLVDFTEPVAKGMKMPIGMVQNPRPNIDNFMGKGVVPQRL